MTHNSDMIPRHQLPECCGGDAPCPYHAEVMLLRQQVITDPLTGLFNIRYFRQALEQEMERTDRTGLPTALMMLDLDHFKKMNDTHGHEVGNLVLQHISRLIYDGTRKLDIQCRYGGEEFAIILPSTEHRLALSVATRLRESIEQTPMLFGETSLKITASIGFALYESAMAITTSELIAEADSYLYEAKYNGRNQVCHLVEEVRESATVTSEEKDLMRSLFAGSIMGE